MRCTPAWLPGLHTLQPRLPLRETLVPGVLEQLLYSTGSTKGENLPIYPWSHHHCT